MKLTSITSIPNVRGIGVFHRIYTDSDKVFFDIDDQFINGKWYSRIRKQTYNQETEDIGEIPYNRERIDWSKIISTIKEYENFSDILKSFKFKTVI